MSRNLINFLGRGSLPHLVGVENSKIHTVKLNLVMFHLPPVIERQSSVPISIKNALILNVVQISRMFHEGMLRHEKRKFF